MNEIRLEHITKQYGKLTALEDISLSFGGNKIYGLLGRNGAGKSTMLNLISNRIFPSGGSVLIDGESAMENDRALGKMFVMSEKTLYNDAARVNQIFRWTEGFYPDFDMDYANGLAKQFGLNTKQKVRNLSTGYLSIFKLILAMSVNTPYVLLDEPVLGLDANHRELFYKELVRRYSEHPCTVVISTHLIEEVADLIEQVVIIKDGHLLMDKPAEEVRAMGYSISGKAEDVDAYIAGKEVLSVDSLGGLKTACLLGKPENTGETLTITPLDMQKLFVQLTNA